MEAFTSAAAAIASEDARCDAFHRAVAPTPTCRKDPIMSEYLKSIQARAEAIKDCSTKITLVGTFCILFHKPCQFYYDPRVSQFRKTLPSGTNSDFVEIGQEYLAFVIALVDLYVYVNYMIAHSDLNFI